MKWICKLFKRLFCRNTVKIQHKQLEEFCMILDTLSGERVNNIIEDTLSRSLTSEELMNLRKDHFISSSILKRRLDVCEASVGMLLTQISKYTPYLMLGQTQILDQTYVEIAFRMTPSLLIELIQYGNQQQRDEDTLTKLSRQMDYVRKVRKDLFLINKNSPHQ